MATSQSLIGLAGIGLLFVWCALAVVPWQRRGLVAALALGIAWLPVSGLPLAGYVRALSSDLSFTSMALLACVIASQLGAFSMGSMAEWRFVFRLVASGGLFLYPMVLGLGPFDPYTLGFAPTGLLSVLALFAGLAWWRHYHFCLGIIVLAVLAYRLDVLESSNLWDYVLDPWLVLYAIYDLRPWRRNS